MSDERQKKTWIYGVIPAGARLEELERRRDRLPSDIRVVELGELATIVGDAPGEDAKAIRDQALAHARVLEAAVVDAPVLPFRFGSVLANGDVASELLEARYDDLVQLLERVKDHVQLILKASYREEAVLREIVEAEPEIARLREQTRAIDEILSRDARMRLGELISIALEQIRQRDATAILQRLSRFAVASAVEPLEAEYMALNAPFLVEREHVKEFEDAAGALADEQAERMQLTLLGPMPTYNFIGVEQQAWA